MKSFWQKNLEALLFFGSWALATVALIWFGQNRLIARDEGYYLYAAELVSQGLTPYRDFFYPQMPGLPYFYGFFLKIFGASWENGRLLSCGLSAMLLLLLMLAVKKHGRIFPLVVAIIFAAANFVFPWYCTVQTYALAGLLSFAGFLVLNQVTLSAKKSFGNKQNDFFKIALAGFLIGSAVSVRLTFIVLFPAACLHFILTARAQAIKPILALTFGGFIAAIPTLLLAISYWDHFFYNNIGYHLVRSDKAPEQDWKHKQRVISVLFGLTPTLKFSAWQFPLLLWLSCAQFCSDLFKKKIALCSLIIISLALMHLQPKPTYVQYFAALMPWLIFSVILLLASIKNYFGKLYLLVLCLMLVIYCFNFKKDIRSYTQSGRGVIGIMTKENAKKWNLAAVEQARTSIARLAKSEDQIVYALWPGYLVGSGAKSLAGGENHFAPLGAARMPREQAQHHKLLSYEELIEKIQRREVPLVVIFNLNKTSRIEKNLQKANYRLAEKQRAVLIYSSK